MSYEIISFNKNKKTQIHEANTMEVDREPMDLNNSSRTTFATMELVDSTIFTTFYFVFRDFLFYFTSTAPHTILHIHTFKSSHLFT